MPRVQEVCLGYVRSSCAGLSRPTRTPALRASFLFIILGALCSPPGLLCPVVRDLIEVQCDHTKSKQK